VKLKIVNYIRYFLKKRADIKKRLYCYRAYLKDGYYLLQPSYAYLQNSQVFLKSEIQNIFLKMLFRRKVLLSSPDKKFYGNLLFCNAQGGIKIFNDQEVLTFLKRDKIDGMQKLYMQIENFFHIPKILKVEQDYYIERFIIDKKKRSFEEVEEIYQLLLNFYKERSFIHKSINISAIVWQRFSVKNRLFVESLSQTSSYAYVVSHNDIHFGNIIINQDIYIIDWEYFGENLFFYDFMNLLFIEALGGDYRFLDSFFNGHFDAVFHTLFQLFDMKYDTADRMQYCNAYLLQKIILRDLQEDNRHLNRVVARYKEVKEHYC